LSDRFLVFGLSKGTVIFISLENLEQIFSRFSIHRQSVEQIYEMKQSKNMISVCSELSLCIWGFASGKCQSYKYFQVMRPLTDIKIMNDLVFVGFKTGDTEMFLWREQEKEFYKLNCEKMDEHEDQLEAVDYLNDQGLFVTGGRDGLVKIWNIKKELIREIKFPDPITSVLFLNQQGDILVGHIGKVSSVLAADYKPFEVSDLTSPPPEELT